MLSNVGLSKTQISFQTKVLATKIILSKIACLTEMMFLATSKLNGFDVRQKHNHGKYQARNVPLPPILTIPTFQVDEITQIVTMEVSLRLHWFDERIKIAEETLQSMGQDEEYVTLNPRLAKYFWIPGGWMINRSPSRLFVQMRVYQAPQPQHLAVLLYHEHTNTPTYKREGDIL